MILYGLIFYAGLIGGVFISICIHRLPLKQSLISPPPYCPSCGTNLKTDELIPLLGYIRWRGRCSHCGKKLSGRYLTVNLVCGLITVALYAKYGLTVDFGALLFLMYILIGVFFIDLEHQIIPNELVIAGLSGGVILFIYNLFRPFQIYSDRLWWNPLLGFVSGSGLLLGVAFIGSLFYRNREVMGMGDVKLLAPIGLFLGWRMTLLALYIAVISGGLSALVLIVSGKASRKSMIPFGPFIVGGVFITVMWGWDIVHWYLNTFCFWH